MDKDLKERVMLFKELMHFFGWCVILNLVILFISTLFMIYGRNFVYRLHAKLFNISEESFNTIAYAYLGFYKLLFLIFVLVPYLGLLLC